MGGATKDLMCPVLEVHQLRGLDLLNFFYILYIYNVLLKMPLLCASVLQFEADRRAFIITVNSFGTDLSGADRSALYPSCGKLYPAGLRLLAKAEDPEQVKAVADCYPVSLISSLMRAAVLLCQTRG